MRIRERHCSIGIPLVFCIDNKSSLQQKNKFANGERDNPAPAVISFMQIFQIAMDFRCVGLQ